MIKSILHVTVFCFLVSFSHTRIAAQHAIEVYISGQRSLLHNYSIDQGSPLHYGGGQKSSFFTPKVSGKYIRTGERHNLTASISFFRIKGLSSPAYAFYYEGHHGSSAGTLDLYVNYQMFQGSVGYQYNFLKGRSDLNVRLGPSIDLGTQFGRVAYVVINGEKVAYEDFSKYSDVFKKGNKGLHAGLSMNLHVQKKVGPIVLVWGAYYQVPNFFGAILGNARFTGFIWAFQEYHVGTDLGIRIPILKKVE